MRLLFYLVSLLPTAVCAFNIFSERYDGVPSTPSAHKTPRYFTFSAEDEHNSDEHQRTLREFGIEPFKDPIENNTYLDARASRAKITLQKSAAAAQRKRACDAQKPKQKRSPTFKARLKKKPAIFVSQKKMAPMKKAQWR